ncbi:MAG TPA: PEGA domain-containing protein [Polyangiaceae bacterium]|nr:PEGA domain-containing protein [Polyangiaceae bacterium]
MQRRNVVIGMGAGAVVLAVLAWWFLVPARLGLTQPRLVIVSGDARVDDVRAKVAQTLAVGATVRTGYGSACFSLHESRVCVGAQSEAHLADLGKTSAIVEAKRGTVVVVAGTDEVHVSIPTVGGVDVHGATVSVEGAGADTVVRALDGSVTVEASGRPDTVVAAPTAMGLRDGNKRASSPALESEERAVAQLAHRWQGSAGATIEVNGMRGRVSIDGTDVGSTPAAVLLDEGEHTLEVRESAREGTKENLTLRGGQKVVRGS